MSVEVKGVLVTFSRYDLGCFQLVLAVFRSTPAPAPMKETGSSSHELGSATEYVTGPNPLSARGLKATSLEVPLLIATSTDWIHFSLRIPAQLWAALDVSHILGDFSPNRPCGLISFHCRVQDSLYRGFPRYQAGMSRRHPVPS
jgi:hypothetical protein